MTSAQLPIRYEISSTSGSGSMKQICATAISEGGYSPYGKIFSASNGITTIGSIGQTEKPLLTLVK